MSQAEKSSFLAHKRCAVVTGGNKGIGLEICRQLASQDVVVVLTARNETRGLEALDNLKKSELNPHNLLFRQLDVTDPMSISSLADFVRVKFGKLDILVNNAGILGAVVDFDAVTAAGFGTEGAQIDYSDYTIQTYEHTADCLNTNYHGAKRTVEALLPLLQLSDSPRIVNISSSLGKLGDIPNEEVRETLNNPEKLTEGKLDEVLNEYLRCFKDGSLSTKGWRSFYPAYNMSKASLNSYTRILAKKYPSIIINCLCPGFVKTDLNNNTGISSVEEAGACCVSLALVPHGSPSGLFFFRNEVSSFV